MTIFAARRLAAAAGADDPEATMQLDFEVELVQDVVVAEPATHSPDRDAGAS